MLSTRNLRVIVAVLAIFGIVAFFATSQNSLGTSIQRVNSAAGVSSADNIPGKDESQNTLQGSGHKGTDAPYAQEPPRTRPGSAEKPKVMADKTNAKIHDDEKPVLDNYKEPKPDLKSGSKPVSGACKESKFVVMIDAGSTGSRVHVYEFDTCKSPPALLKEEFKMLKPGLSSFDTDTIGAASSLDPLLEVALKTVPKSQQGCTPVAVKATAGLRLLGKEKSDAILAEVRKHLENDYPFAVVDGNGISIMDGKDEGVYAWITTNYLLGNIGTADKGSTAAVFDLGGGSTQIVFEPEFGNNERMVEGEHKYEFTFGDRDFTLYQFSHLGYGLMEGRNKVNSLIVSDHLAKNAELSASKLTSKSAAKEAKASVTLSSPCVPPEVVAENVMVQLGESEFYVVNFKGASVASGAQCRALSEKILNKDLECKQKPCSFNGVHQPLLTKAFHKDSDMFVFSYFYDRTNPLGFPSSFTMQELAELTNVVCHGSKLWTDVLLNDHIKELAEEPQWCLDLSFITAMLHTGYDIPLHRELKTAKTIDNNELGWCLGASLPLLEPKTGGWKCRLEQVQ